MKKRTLLFGLLAGGLYLFPATVLVRKKKHPSAIDYMFSHGKDQWISSAATTWSTMALMLACEKNQ